MSQMRPWKVFITTTAPFWGPFSTKLALTLEPVSLKIVGTSMTSSKPALVSSIVIKNGSMWEWQNSQLPIEYDTPTSVPTSGQWKPAMVCSSWTNFLGSEPVYSSLKCSEGLKIRCMNHHPTSFMLVEKGTRCFGFLFRLRNLFSLFYTGGCF